MSLDNQDSTRSREAGEAVSALTVRLPQFWERHPTTWFLQAEAQFQLARITSQETKFLHVVGALPPTAAEEISDILTSFNHTRPAAPYDQLKAALLERTAASERTRIQQLLSSEELGGRRPSQLLRHMKHLLGTHSHAMDDTLLRELFLQRLPSNVQMVLATAAAMDLQALAALADKVMEVATPFSEVAAVASAKPPSPPCPRNPASASSESAASSRLDSLCDRLEKIIVAATRRDVSPQRSRQRRRSSSQRRRPERPRSESPNPGICYYHRRFGADARHCRLPCTWTGNGLADR